MDVSQPIIIRVKPAPGSEVQDHSDTDESRNCHVEEELVALEDTSAPPATGAGSDGETISMPLANGAVTVSPVMSPQLDTEEVSRTLEWFRETLTRISKNGRVSLKDFKYAARECEVELLPPCDS